MTLDHKTLAYLPKALKLLERAFEDMPAFEPQINQQAVADVLSEVAVRMQHNFPYPHPLYAGQMIKPPHPIARLAYMLSIWINPNNHALDGSLTSSPMEKEAVADLAAMIGFPQHLGHLCSGGTMANLEALWIAGCMQPGKTILASSQAHYTHRRLTQVLGLPFESLPVDQQARMDLVALEERLKQGDVGCVVVTMGTTSVGAVDPLPQILQLQKIYDFRIHADAAYGGYFKLIPTLAKETRLAFSLLHRVDSLVIDPHKHGLQPYGCGCVLFRDPSVGRYYKHDSPYTYFSSEELHLGEISLECSRPGASAVALWATHQLMPLVPEGEFAKTLGQGRKAATQLFERLSHEDRFQIAFPPELDIVIWAPKGSSVTSVSQRSQQIFEQAAQHHLHLAVAKLPKSLLEPFWPHLKWDAAQIKVLRSCLMKPEHLDWLDTIWERLLKATDEVLG